MPIEQKIELLMTMAGDDREANPARRLSCRLDCDTRTMSARFVR